MKTIYLIGALRNQEIPVLAQELRTRGYDVFDDWHSPGPDTDKFWRKYEQGRKRLFVDAIRGYHAQHIFALDKYHLDRADLGVLVLPAGRSGHLELGYLIGRGKPGYILMPGEPTRYDLMYAFATRVFTSKSDFLLELEEHYAE